MNYLGSFYKPHPYQQNVLMGSFMNNHNVQGSSCYTLTPASSTSSLADFAKNSYTTAMAPPNDTMNMSLNMTAVSESNQAQKKPTAKRSRQTKTVISTTTDSSQARYLNCSIASAYSTSLLPNLTCASSTDFNQTHNSSMISAAPVIEAPSTETVKRKRGRPPKNQQNNNIQKVKDQPQQQQQQQYQQKELVTLIQNPGLNNIIPTNSTTNSLNSVIDNRSNRTTLVKAKTQPNANLQRNKISAPSNNNFDSKPKTTSLIAMYYTPEEHSQTTPMPNINWAHGDDVWRAMRKNELKYVHDPNYMSRHSGIQPHMRGILLDWIVELCHAYRLHRETFHLSVEYMDRYLTLANKEMRIDRLQLLGMTCLFLAAKVEEIYPPKLKDFASHMENYSNDNEEAVQQFELAILETFEWKISPVTANVWLQVYLQIAAHNTHIVTCFYSQDINSTNYSEVNYSRTCILKPDDYFQVPKNQSQTTLFVLPLNILKNQINRQGTPYTFSPKQEQFYLQSYMKAVTLLDLCTFDMDSLRFKYSVLAASAMFLMLNSSSRITDIDLVMRVVQDCTGYKMNELESCIQWMHAYADVCKEVLTVERMVFIRKFQTVDDDDAHNIQLFHKNLELLVSI
jgi:hypothetical protein